MYELNTTVQYDPIRFLIKNIQKLLSLFFLFYLYIR